MNKVTEKEMRTALRKYVKPEPKDEIYLREEVPIYDSRIDMFATTKECLEFVGYEIKSDYDTVSRLKKQLKWYSCVLDKLWLVCGERRVVDGMRNVPDWVGILLVIKKDDGQIKILTIRNAEKNTSIECGHLAGMLTKEQMLKVLKKFNLHKNLSSEPRDSVVYALNNHALKNKEVFAETKKAVKDKVFFLI